jgi:UPF0042 nucleotide-binding protein
MSILVQSFGFKYGVPVDCDCVRDVRLFPNPFYDQSLPICQSGRSRFASLSWNMM